MTEEEWADCSPGYLSSRSAAKSPRKLRLLAAAICRHFTWMQQCDGVGSAIEVIEQYADTGKSKAALRQVRQKMVETRSTFEDDDPVWQDFVRWSLFIVQVAAAENAVTGTLRTAVEILMRKDGFSETGAWRELRLPVSDIVGNPFRPVTFDHRWRSEAAVTLATGIYADRAFDRMPVLADALEEAGCDHPDVLAHCRASGPHARGCWVVDLVLNKS